MFWKGMLGYLPANVAQAVTGVLAIVVFTRLLTPQEYGVYALAFAITSLSHTALFTWLEAALARHTAAEREGGGFPAMLATVYPTSALLALAFCAVAATILWLAPLDLPLRTACLIGLLGAPLRHLVKLAQERRAADGQVAQASGLDAATTVGAFAIGVALARLGLGGAAPMAGMAIMALLLALLTAPRDVPQARGARFDPARLRRYFAYGAPVSMSAIMVLTLVTTDRFVLAAFTDEATVGRYQAGYSLASRALDVIFIWLGMAGGPAAVAAFERGGLDALLSPARQQISMMFLIGLPACAGLMLTAQPLAAVMVGEELRAGAAHTIPFIAVFGLLSGLTTYYFITALTLARRTGLMLVAMAIPAFSNLALNLVLTPRYGLEGALWATVISAALGSTAAVVLGRRCIKLPAPTDVLLRCALATGVMAAAVVAMPELGGAPELVLKVVAGVIAYAAAVLVLDAAGVRSRGWGWLAERRARAAGGAAKDAAGDAA